MTKLTSVKDVKVGDVVEYIGGENEYLSKYYFTIGKHYTVGGMYHEYYLSGIGVTSDDKGCENGHHFERFRKVAESSSEPMTAFDAFDPWWNKYYPQEYGYNAEFRDIVTKHARRAWEEGKGGGVK